MSLEERVKRHKEIVEELNRVYEQKNTDYVIEWKNFDNSIQNNYNGFITFADSSAASVLSKIADFYSSCGLEYVTEASNLKDAAENLVNGETSSGANQDSLETVKRYPKAALKTLSAMDSYIVPAEKVLSSSLNKLKTPYIDKYGEPYLSIEKSVQTLGELKSDAAEIRNKAKTMAAYSDNAKTDAAEKFAAAKKSLAGKNFTKARENLARASAKYLESLLYNEDEDLRRSSDIALRELGEEINRQENIIVVRDVRKLKNQAKDEFDRDNFENAERLLRRAAERWAVTNVDEDVEIVNAVPQIHAGGSFATICYERFEAPVVLEEIKADAGMDIGDTFIGMHLKKVAVPIRISTKKIGKANVTAARTRPKFIGGYRAKYSSFLAKGRELYDGEVLK